MVFCYTARKTVCFVLVDTGLGGKQPGCLADLLTWCSYMFTENKGATVHGLSPLTILASEFVQQCEW